MRRELKRREPWRSPLHRPCQPRFSDEQLISRKEPVS